LENWGVLAQDYNNPWEWVTGELNWLSNWFFPRRIWRVFSKFLILGIFPFPKRFLERKGQNLGFNFSAKIPRGFFFPLQVALIPGVSNRPAGLWNFVCPFGVLEVFPGGFFGLKRAPSRK